MTAIPIILTFSSLTAFVIATGIVMNTLAIALRLLPEIPWEDGWKTAIMLSNGPGLTITNIFQQHNEHRVPLTHLVDLLDIWIFGGRNLFHFCVAVSATALLAATVGRLAIAATRFSKSKKINIYSLVFGILFSQPQLEIFFWPFTIGNILSNLFVVLTFAILTQAGGSNPYLLMCAILTGVLAVFGLASGLLVWPLGVMILIATERRISISLLTWIIAAILVFSWYFHDYTRPEHHASPVITLTEHFFDFTAFALLLLGSLVGAHGVAISAAVGGVISTLIASAVNRAVTSFMTLSRGFLALIAIMIFCCLSAVAAAGSRINFGLEHALISRYSTISALALVSVIAFQFGNSPPDARTETLSKIATSVLILVILATISMIPTRNIEWFEDTSARLKSNAIAMALHIDDVPMRYWNPTIQSEVANAIKLLEARRLSVFHDNTYDIGIRISARYRVVRSSRCVGRVDSVDQLPDERGAQRIKGWAWLKDSQRRADRIALADANGRIIGWASSGWTRTDVPEIIMPDRRSGWLGYARGNLPASVLAFAVNDNTGTACLIV
ncbi:hypothetical protein [Methylococcus sp. Mc7]|uniref:hypothetical protein n=1 Tax=Methylococcus sp. Mc7 TaxID=2860258 RepID=UPI001C52933A|nr:hypothetical protein [Methylococcus sp. Mc7]QXP85929.1 hypothetical protein KW115_09675 [Methylococcus sp. Mc7]